MWKQIVSFFECSDLHYKPILFLVPLTFCFRNNSVNRFQIHWESLMFYRPHLRCSTLRRNVIDLEITIVNCALPQTVFGRLTLITLPNRHNSYIWKLLQFFLKCFIKNITVFECKNWILCFWSETCLCNFLFKLD